METVMTMHGKRSTEKRGLMNYPSTPDCMPHLLDEKNVRMLTSHKVFSKAELESRCEIMLENYCKTIVIEANTMVDMVKREIIPAVEAYAMELARTASAKKRVDETLACRYESGLIKKLSTLTDQMAVRDGCIGNSSDRTSGREGYCGAVLSDPGYSIDQNAGVTNCL